MPIELGSFNVIIGMDWLANHHAVIVCDEKIVRIPYRDEVLIVQCDRSEEKANEERADVGDITKVFTEDLLDYRLRETKVELQNRLGLCRTVCASSYRVPYSREPRSCFVKKEDVSFRMCMIIREEEHAEHLKLILELLKKEELYTNFLKCEFWLSKVQFLGHVINSEGIHVDPAKIESIKDWESPKTPTEIHQFIGLAGYYRRFIKGSENFVVTVKLSLKDWARFDAKEEDLRSLEVGYLVKIKKIIQAARDRQKSYADKRRKPLEFEVGDKVMLKVSPWKGNSVEIMDREVKRLKQSRIPIVKIRRIQFSIQYSVFIQQINTAYPLPLDTAYRSSGTEADSKFSLIDFRANFFYLSSEQILLIVYPLFQILDSRGVVPTKTTEDAKMAIQEMVEYSQKWHNGTSRGRSTETSDRLAAIQAQLNNLGREIKKVNKKVYATQVGCEQCKGPHYTKDCPLKKKGKP
ncbi:hypothetical protein Tco_0673329 [Tanacetum coccineum]